MTAMASGEWGKRVVAAPPAIIYTNEPVRLRAFDGTEFSDTVATRSTHRASPPPAALDLPGSTATDRVGFTQRFYLAYAKRTIDVVLALILLTVFSPIMLAVACLIVLDSPGRAIYSQRRLGYGQREFTIYKFRSMAVHAHVILATDPELAAQYAVHWKLVRDPRVTRFGAFLRKTSLDELPQLLNVLKGEMSIVGPRPYLPQELKDEFGAHADLITAVKPGITGLWQVSGRSRLGPSERIELDGVYAQTCDARLDTVILFKTVKVVFWGHGAV